MGHAPIAQGGTQTWACGFVPGNADHYTMEVLTDIVDSKWQTLQNLLGMNMRVDDVVSPTDGASLTEHFFLQPGERRRGNSQLHWSGPLVLQH